MPSLSVRSVDTLQRYSAQVPVASAHLCRPLALSGDRRRGTNAVKDCYLGGRCGASPLGSDPAAHLAKGGVFARRWLPA